MTTLTLNADYGYVLLAATSTFFMNMAHSFNTGTLRKAAKVDYPAAYAPAERKDKEAMRFNCAQRSHAQFIENQPTALAALLIAGLRYPIAAASMGAFWTVFRFLYMQGYSRGDVGGKGRARGHPWVLAQLGLVSLAGYTGLSLVMGW